MLNAYFNGIVRHPGWTIAICCVIALAFAYTARNTQIDGDYQVFFSDEDPLLVSYRQIEETYSRQDSVLVVVHSSDGRLFSRETLAVIEQLTEASWQLPYARRVDSITNFQNTWASGDDLRVQALFGDLPELSETEIAARREIAMNEPQLVGALLAPNGRSAIVATTVLLPKEKLTENQEVTEAARALVSDFAARYPALDFYLTGTIPINQGFVDSAGNDLVKLTPLMYLVMLVLVMLLLKSVSAAIATLLLTIASIMVAMGAAALIGYPITAPSANAFNIILAVSVANTVHLSSTALASRARGQSKTLAIATSLHSNGLPVLLTSLTTIIGFLCLNTSDVPPYRFLGNTAAVGVAASFVFAFSLLPALLAVLPMPAHARDLSTGKWLNFGTVVVRRQRMFGPILLFVSIALCLAATRNEVNDSFVTYFDEDTAIRIDSEFMMREVAGAYSITYSIPSGQANGITDPDYMRRIEAFSQWALEQPEVRHVSSLNQILKRVNRSMSGDDPAAYRLPESRELGAQYLLMYELSLPQGLDMTQQIDIDKAATRVLVSLNNITTREMRAFENRAEVWMAENWPEPMRTQGSGPALMFAHIWDRSVHSNLRGVLIAVVLIVLTIMIALRSVRYGLISIIPNALPPLAAFGIWAFVSGRLDVGASNVLLICLGIIVDDTIHFLTRYRRLTAAGVLPARAIPMVFAEVGPALLTTTLVLVCGFSLLALSDFGGNVSIGVLTAITVALAWILDMLLLPALLLWLDGDRALSTRATVPKLTTG